MFDQEEFFDPPKGKKGRVVSVFKLTPKGERYFEATQEYLAKLDAIDADLGINVGVSQSLKDLRRAGLMESIIQIVGEKRGHTSLGRKDGED